MTADATIARAIAQVEAALAGDGARPQVQCFFDEPTSTASYVISDPATGHVAILDSVLGFDQAAGRTSTASADRIADYVQQQALTVDWLLETHVHADHLSAAGHLHDRLGGKTGVGCEVITVQRSFAETFNEGPDFATDGSQFDRLFRDGEGFSVGDIPALALHVAGHTPADVAYLIGDALFVGDTLFMPDYGTARCDFPGGDPRALYRSIRRLLQLPDATRMFLCHDYKAPPARTEFAWETTVAEQRRNNVHVHDNVSEDEFVAMRSARDATLCVPKLIFASVQVNIRGGRLPEPEANGTRYLKLPLDCF